MPLSRYLWLLLCYAQYARSNLIEEYEEISNKFIYTRYEQNEPLPIELGKDRSSGCLCRASENRKVVVCFGNYECRQFPKVTFKSQRLKVRTTAIVDVKKGDLDAYYYLNILEIDANHQLKHIEPGSFRNLTNLRQLSISYNTLLEGIQEDTFEGLNNLRNLTLVNNGFNNILQLTPAFKPIILPALKGLDISENVFETIPENAFLPMKGTNLKRLEINLCRLDFIHPNSLLVLNHLETLNIADNDLKSTLIADFLKRMTDEGINLIHLDLSGLGFRKQPPRDVLDVVANSTIKYLILARNQFEIIPDDAFPRMKNIEYIDLRKVHVIKIDPNTFDPLKFPNLKVLLLSGNNLPGIHKRPQSSQMLLLDLSDNKGSTSNPNYYEIDRDTFINSNKLKILNIGFNSIWTIFDYTFRGLDSLKILNIQNATITHIGDGSFQYLKNLELLNFANNPLMANENLTGSQFDGLHLLKVLILENCGIKQFYEQDNMFESVPNLTHLVLKNNQLSYISAEILKPLKFLQVLDLSQNLLVSWWKPLFLTSGVRPHKLYLTNNKISHFSIGMIQDVSYLLENRSGVEIGLMDNIFICDCSSMFKSYRWLQVNGSESLKRFFFSSSNFRCSSPDIWENRRVVDYLSSLKTLQCLMSERVTNVMLLVWTAPSLVTVALIFIVAFVIYKYRIYIRYWIFLAKLTLGRNDSKNAPQTKEKSYKYDAFVSYSSEDRDFVLNLMSQLENNPPYLKLCVYERDFRIGSFLSECVQNCIHDSKYIILIVSNSFVKSLFCHFGVVGRHI